MTALYYGQRPLLKVMTALICRLGQLKNYIIVDKWLGICVTIEGKIRKKIEISKSKHSEIIWQKIV